MSWAVRQRTPNKHVGRVPKMTTSARAFSPVVKHRTALGVRAIVVRLQARRVRDTALTVLQKHPERTVVLVAGRFQQVLPVVKVRLGVCLEEVILLDVRVKLCA